MDNSRTIQPSTYVVAVGAMLFFCVSIFFILNPAFAVLVSCMFFLAITTQKSEGAKSEIAYFRTVTQLFVSVACMMFVDTTGYISLCKALWSDDFFRLGYMVSVSVTFLLFLIVHKCVMPIFEWNLFASCASDCPDSLSDAESVCACPRSLDDAESVEFEDKKNGKN